MFDLKMFVENLLTRHQGDKDYSDYDKTYFKHSHYMAAIFANCRLLDYLIQQKWFDGSMSAEQIHHELGLILNDLERMRDQNVSSGGYTRHSLGMKNFIALVESNKIYELGRSIGHLSSD